MTNANEIGRRITNLRALVGRLSARAVAGEDLNTGAISDANDQANIAVSYLRDGDLDGAYEAIVLGEEQAAAAE